MKKTITDNNTDDAITTINDFCREMSTRRDVPSGLLEVYRRQHIQERNTFNFFETDFASFCLEPN